MILSLRNIVLIVVWLQTSALFGYDSVFALAIDFSEQQKDILNKGQCCYM